MVKLLLPVFLNLAIYIAVTRRWLRTCLTNEFIPHTDRLDYLAPLCNNVAWVLAVEKLAGIEAPPRAQYIRMLVSELSRMASHLVAVGSLAMDVGALTVFLWTIQRTRKNS